MPGKSYSINEQKAIVDYIVQNKLYGEIRGRKMWVDFANTQLLGRTWQSMKETFLKRILGDVQNPCYGLTVQQISSFRAGYDVEQPRLEFQTISSSSEEDKQENKEPKSSKANENTSAGEGIKCSKIENRNRSSTETLVLERYTTAEEIQRILESDCEPPSPKKSLKDCIVFSQPLTPMLQAVVDDFSTDEEPQMQIVEDAQELQAMQERIKETNILESNITKSPVKECQSKDTVDIPTDVNKITTNINSDTTNKLPAAKSKSLKLKKSRKTKPNKNDAPKDSDETYCSDNASVSSNKKKCVEESKEDHKEKSTNENFPSDTPDSVLPNNQEALENNNSNKRHSNESITVATTEPEVKDIVIEVDVASVSDTEENSQHQNAVANNDSKTKSDDSEPLNEASNNTKNAQEINPCLKIVSLFEEKSRKYSDLDSDDEALAEIRNNKSKKDDKINTDKPKESANIDKPTNNDNNGKVNNMQQTESKVKQVEVNKIDKSEKKTNNFNEVVLLKSHSDTDSEVFEPPSKKVTKNVNMNKEQKSKAIANILGFTSERPSRKRTVSHRERSHRARSCRHRTVSQHSRNPVDRHSASSDGYSTNSEDDYSPPHKSSKYVLPQAYNIMRFPGDGGLFITEGKKIYTIVKELKNMKNFISYSDDESERSQESSKASYWKAKYIEEHKRLEEEKQRCEQMMRILRATEQQVNVPSNNQDNLQTVAISSSSEEVRRKEDASRLSTEDNGRNNPTVKIKVNRDNEIELECKWKQLNPILEKMADLFHPPSHAPEPALSSKSNSEPVLISSGKTTPVIDPEVHEKVSKIEDEIFKEIEERDKSLNDDISPSAGNVTQRKRGRPKKVSAASTTSLQVNASKSTTESVKDNERVSQGDMIENRTEFKETSPVLTKPLNDIKPQRKNKGKSKKSTDSVEEKKTKDDLQVASTVARKQSRSPNKSVASLKSTKSPRQSNSTVSQKSPGNARSRSTSRQKVEIPDDESVRYKLPARKGRPRKTDQIASGSYVPTRVTSPECNSRNSVDSTLGYQDSDVSPSILVEKRKKKLNLSNPLFKGREFRSKIRRRSHPYLADHAFYERYKSLKISIRRSRNSSVDTAVYRSESYDLLMNKIRSSFKKLDKIDDNSALNDTEISNYLTPDSIPMVDSNNINPNVNNANSKTDDNSSNVSLPLSPALSIVENISISKETISNLDVSHPTINETLHNNDVTMKTDTSKYLISEVDTSLPLMEQNCEIHKKSSNLDKSGSAVSDSLINKISSVNIGVQSPSEALHVKLQKLLLESAKKVKQLQDIQCSMETDAEPIKQNKQQKRKRSSTPRKKGPGRKKKAASVEPVLEEHTESCSRAGRQSCPPTINIIPCSDDDNAEVDKPLKTRKDRKKKDIIKVKIQKPINKKLRRPKSDSRLSNNATKEESGICLHVSDDSVDLIHNHSETCLHVNECINDSLEIIENNSDNIIVIESSSSENSRSVDENKHDVDESKCEKHGISESFTCNDQEATQFKANPKPHIGEIYSQSGETVYHTPKSDDGSNNSLITEDLSDESPPRVRRQLSNWHLISEEETVTNSCDINANQHGTYVYSDLNQIFPVTCAVPNLSTITENTESNSRKPTNEKECSEVMNSKSIFDTVF